MSVLAITAACLTDRADARHAVFGQWRVTGSICAPGGCALSRVEAENWQGRIATKTATRSADSLSTPAPVRATRWITGRPTACTGGASFADLGIAGDSALVVVIRCPGQPPTSLLNDSWQVPGAFLIVKDPDHLLVEREVVFVWLTRQ
jgi:hypothetical protein